MGDTDGERIARLEERVSHLLDKAKSREKREWALLAAVLGMVLQYVTRMIQ